MEVVHDGWLLKSPPPKRLWRAKWRDRWFVLRAGELPGQYFLEYYTDSSCRKLKGKIDLDQCEQVDAGITFAQRKFEYKFMFDIKTPKRTYYLCADTEEVMNKWVESVCQVCGLRVMNRDNFYDPLANQLGPMTPSSPQNQMNLDQRRPGMEPCVESPPPSAASTVSGPYIPISECITGKKPQSTRFPFSDDVHLSLSQDRSSIPNEMAPPAPVQKKDRQTKLSVTNSEDSAFGSPTDSCFQDDPMTPYGKECLVSYDKGFVPPRPPKPPHLVEPQSYMNIDIVRKNSLSDRTSSSSTPLIKSSTSSDPEPSPADSSIFAYDSVQSKISDARNMDSRVSPSAIYSNLPLHFAPTVDRGLKPKSNIIEEGAVGGTPSSGPPIVNRSLKPQKMLSEPSVGGVGFSPKFDNAIGVSPKFDNAIGVSPKFVEFGNPPKFNLAPVPRSRPKDTRPSQSPSPLKNGKTNDSSDDDSDNESGSDEAVFLPNNTLMKRSSNEIQYLDLDLYSNSSQKNDIKPPEPSVVYKKVDFLKTEAFNKTRQSIEEGYRKGQ